MSDEVLHELMGKIGELGFNFLAGLQEMMNIHLTDWRG